MWGVRQQLQDNYHKLLLINLEKSIKSGVEMDLWRFTCYNFISKMQSYLSHNKNIAGNYKLFLSASTGFFSQLLLELCGCYKRKIQSIPSNRYLGLIDEKNNQLLVEEHFKYMCHFCLVKLGDLARYHSDKNCAATFYQQALKVKPQNGQPYNQLAIISSNTDNDINTLYLHIRSIAISFPFLVGQANLNNFLLKSITLPNKTYHQQAYTLCKLVYGLQYCSTEDIAINDLCKEFLTRLQAKLRSMDGVAMDEIVQISSILVFLHSDCLRQNSEHFNAIYSFLLDVLMLLVSEAAESSCIDVMALLLPPAIILLHWLQKFYLADKPDLININMWSNIANLINKQTKLYMNDMLGVQKDMVGITTATPEEETLRYFQPLADVLSQYAPSDRLINPDIIRLDRLKNVMKWATINNLYSSDNKGNFRFDGSVKISHQPNNVPMFVSMQMPSGALSYHPQHSERAPFMPSNDMPGLPYRELSSLTLNANEPFSSLSEPNAEFNPQTFLPHPSNLPSGKIIVPPHKDDKIGQPILNNGASLFPGSHIPQAAPTAHMTPELYNPMYSSNNLPIIPTCEALASKHNDQFHFPSSSPFSGDVSTSWPSIPQDNEQDLQGIWSINSKNDAITLQQLLNGKK